MNDPIQDINNFRSVCIKDYADCMHHLDHTEVINGVNANIRFHYIKFDGNGCPLIKRLAETLYDYIIHYCISCRNRDETLTPIQATRLTKEAKGLFVHPPATIDDPDQTGEAGEILLYFLIESVIGAPQVVTKMELKTNQNKEVNGSDGIHMKWCEKDQIVDIYFGESKIHKDISGALGSAFKSISKFHDDGICKHELIMTTKHFKYADNAVKEAVDQLISRGEPSSGVRINHACVIGYNFQEYANLLSKANSTIEQDFLTTYSQDTKRITNLLESRFSSFDKKHLSFEFIFIPFADVQEFRTAFNEALK